jgi:hypothetical protein
MNRRLQRLVFPVAIALILLLGAVSGLFLLALDIPQARAAPLLSDGTRSTITITVLTQNDETAETLNAIDADGNKFYNNGKTWIEIVNNYTATVTATFVTPGTVGGLAIEDKTIAVDASGTSFAGPFSTAYFNQSSPNTNYVYINYSSAITDSTVASVTIGAYRLP